MKSFLLSAPLVLLSTVEDCLATPVARVASPDFSSYAPAGVQCPSNQQWVRPANGLSDEEAQWVKGRKSKVVKELTSYLKNLKLEGLNVDRYVKKMEDDPTKAPTLGMLISGGGWSSAMTGTGMLRAFDNQLPEAVEERTGGLLQSLTYLSGLSGGSWPVMSLSTHNFPSVDDVVSDWHTNQPSSGNTPNRATAAEMFKQVIQKFEAGYNVSMMDYLGRAFGYEFVEGANGGIATMVSDIAKLSKFQSHDMPFPMWQAAGSLPNDTEFYGIKVPSYDAAIFEWNPFEYGSWNDDSPHAFFPTKYLGTKMSNGQPVKDCTVGFDRASFMLGLAADAPNFWYIEAKSNGTLGSFAKRGIEDVEKSLERRETPKKSEFPVEIILDLYKEYKNYFNYTLEECIYASVPNPFVSDKLDSPYGSMEELRMLDGSEMGQSLPLWTQIQPDRKIDFIAAWDSDGDAEPYGWNNGTNMYNTYLYATKRGVPFPVVPQPATFMNRNYTQRPTFFGCDANLTNTKTAEGPIVLYLPNAPYSAYTNYTWFQTNFTAEQMSVILTNGFNYVTQGNSTLDSQWPECIGCAAIDRSLSRLGMERSDQCQSCFDRYCWDGVEDTADPQTVDLSLVLDPSVSFEEWNDISSKLFWAEYGGS